MKVTANRLTLLRILLLPVPCALLYGGPTAKLTAIGVASLLGFTDYLDGKLARRQGVTRLGALLDPIADKIFVAVFYLFLAHLHYLPLWLVGGILLREFLITSLRQMVPGNLPVNWLAKLKTTMQMLVAGLIVVVGVFPAWQRWALVFTAVVLVVGVLFSRFSRTQKALVMLLALALPILGFLPSKELALALGALAFFFTWASATHYFREAWPRLWSKTGLKRMANTLFLPLTALALMPYTGPLWLVVPLILIVEFARQALALLSARQNGNEKWLGFAVLALWGGWLWGPETSLIGGLITILLIDIVFALRQAWQVKAYLQA